MDVHEEIADLRADLRKVRRDLKRALADAGSHSGARIRNTGTRWWEGGKALEDKVEEQVMEVLEEVGTHARRAGRRAKEEVEEHPFLIGLAVAGLAVLAIQLCVRRNY